MSDRESKNAFLLDRPGIRDSFDRASAQYESAAALQASVGEELLSRLEFFKLEPRMILDLGSGTGRGTAGLKRAYPGATVVALDFAPGMLREARRYLNDEATQFERICADALRLPIAEGRVDLIFSNLMLQWCEVPDIAFAEVRRVLKPGGLFVFSTFGPQTLQELRAAWAAADSGSHVNHFIDMHDLGSALMRAGLAEPVLDVERMQRQFPDVRSLMRELKTIGAHNVALDRARGLTTPGRFRRMEEVYEVQRRDGALPATYEVIFGAAWGQGGRPSRRAMGGEIVIPAGAIRVKPG